MKKSFIYFILIAAILTSCKKSENMSNSDDEPQVDMNAVDAPADEINNNEDSENIYQAPSHPCPECDETITPNEYDKISDEQYEKLKSSGFNYSKVTWKMPGIWGYWYVSADCEVSFVKQNNAEGPFCSRCAKSYCEKRNQAEAEESQNIEEEQQQQNKSRGEYYPTCNRCSNEIKSTVYYVSSGHQDGWEVATYKFSMGDEPYHQNCAEEEANYNNQKR
jgi:hypothetical protein